MREMQEQSVQNENRMKYDKVSSICSEYRLNTAVQPRIKKATEDTKKRQLQE